jgi:hypothetical protein
MSINDLIKNALNNVSRQFAFSGKIKVGIENGNETITNIENPLDQGGDGKKTYTISYIYGNIQNEGDALYLKTPDNITTKYSIRLDCYIDNKQPLLKHRDIIAFNNKNYIVEKVQDKSNTGHVVYYANEVYRLII